MHCNEAIANTFMTLRTSARINQGKRNIRQDTDYSHATVSDLHSLGLQSHQLPVNLIPASLAQIPYNTGVKYRSAKRSNEEGTDVLRRNERW